MKSKIYNFSDEEFRQIIQNSKSFKECAEKFGLSANGGNAKLQIRKRCDLLNISYAHFLSKPVFQNGQLINQPKYSYDEILVENSTYTHTSRLRDYLIRDKLLINECSICHLKNIWNNKPLTLQLDHINGDNRDNRLGNLRLLCPNCHSQTDTYGGRNLRQRRAKSED